jgi:parallel beta-helix repeat protein
LNSRFNDCGGDGAAIASGTARIKVLGCTFKSNRDYGIAITDNCSDVVVMGNLALSNLQQGIGIDECRGVTVAGNTCRGNNYGIQFLRFNPDFSQPNNTYLCVGNTLVSNAIGIGVNTSTGVTVTGNKIVQDVGKGIQVVDSTEFTISGNDLSTMAVCEEGIMLQAQSSNTIGDGMISGNRIKGFTSGIRELSTGGTISESSVYSNRLSNNATPLALVNSRAEGNNTQLLYGSLTWDPSSLAAGAGVTTTLTVSGASIGDVVDVMPPYNVQDCVVYGWAFQANGVAIRVQNGTAGTIDLPSGIWKVRIRK